MAWQCLLFQVVEWEPPGAQLQAFMDSALAQAKEPTDKRRRT